MASVIGTLLAALMLSVAVPSGASAYTLTFTCNPHMAGPGQWCMVVPIHTYGMVRTWNDPSEPVYRYCAKLTKPGDLEWYYARKCEWAVNVQVYSDGGGKAPHPNNHVDMKAGIANGMQDNQTHLFLDGLAEY